MIIVIIIIIVMSISLYYYHFISTIIIIIIFNIIIISIIIKSLSFNVMRIYKCKLVERFTYHMYADKKEKQFSSSQSTISIATNYQNWHDVVQMMIWRDDFLQIFLHRIFKCASCRRRKRIRRYLSKSFF